MAMRGYFVESYSTFMSDLNIPLGSYEHFGCDVGGCCITFGVNDSVILWQVPLL